MPQAKAASAANKEKKVKLKNTSALSDVIDTFFVSTYDRRSVASGCFNAFINYLHKSTVPVTVNTMQVYENVKIADLQTLVNAGQPLATLHKNCAGSTTMELTMVKSVAEKYPIAKQFAFKVISYPSDKRINLNGVDYSNQLIIYLPVKLTNAEADKSDELNDYTWLPAFRILITENTTINSNFEENMYRHTDALAATLSPNDRDLYKLSDQVMFGAAPFTGSAYIFVELPALYSISQYIGQDLHFMVRVNYEKFIDELLTTYEKLAWLSARKAISVRPRESSVNNGSYIDTNFNLNYLADSLHITQRLYAEGVGNSANTQDGSGAVPLTAHFFTSGFLNGTFRFNPLDTVAVNNPNNQGSSAVKILLGLYVAPYSTRYDGTHYPSVCKFTAFAYTTKEFTMVFDDIFKHTLSLINQKRVGMINIDKVMVSGVNFVRTDLTSVVCKWHVNYGFSEYVNQLYPELFNSRSSAAVTNAKELESAGFTFNPKWNNSRAFLIIQPNNKSVNPALSRESHSLTDTEGYLKSAVIPLSDGEYSIMLVDNLVKSDDKTSRVLSPSFSLLLTPKGTELVPFDKDLENAIIGQVA
jgi:hypothetical protein